MGGKKTSVGGRVLRFAVSGVLLAGSSGVMACGDDQTRINELPPETFETVNEPDPGPDPEPIERPPSTNEVAPEPETSPEQEEGPRVNTPPPE